MPSRWRTIGKATRSLRRVHLLLELSEVQIHQTRNYRRRLSTPGLQRRTDRQAIQAGQSLLQLLGISEVRNRFLGQADIGNVPAVRRALLIGKDHEERHDALLRE